VKTTPTKHHKNPVDGSKPDWKRRRRWKVAILRRLFHERNRQERIELAIALLQLELIDSGLVAEEIKVRPDLSGVEGYERLAVNGAFSKVLLSLFLSREKPPSGGGRPKDGGTSLD